MGTHDDCDCACHRCHDRGCPKCEPEVCDVCNRLLEFVEDHAECLNK